MAAADGTSPIDDMISDVLLDELSSERYTNESLIDATTTDHVVALLATSQAEPLGTARIYDFVETTVPTYSDGLFKAHFRMSRTSFQALLELVAPHTEVRTISLQRRTLACVWLLSNQETFRSVADRFGMSRGSLHYFLMNFCRLLTGSTILPTMIKWPKEEEYEIMADQFSQRAGFPGVIGAIDGTYIPIPGPSAFRDSYICRKGFPAFHLQGVCNSQLQFLDVFCAYPGSVHDSRVFRNSPLHDHLQEKPPSSQFHLIGDSAYPLANHLLVPFRDNGHLSAQQKAYNLAHSSTRVDIERCFGLLKGKFRKLKFLDCRQVTDVPTLIVACCVLHNFILDQESVSCDDIDTEEIQQASYEEGDENGRDASAEAKRDSIMHMLA